MTKNTHGGPGRNQGRKSLSDAYPTESHSITMPSWYWDYVRAAGNGNLSAGVREAVMCYYEQQLEKARGKHDGT